MVRKIIKPTDQDYLLHIPQEYINKSIEILILPFFENKPFQSKDDDYLGILKNGPTISKEQAIEWESDIRKGYKYWHIDEF